MSAVKGGWKTQTSLQESLPIFSLEVAERELGETDERRIDALRDMQKFLRDDKCTAGIEFEPDYLVRFLRHSKYDVRRAARRLKDFVAMRRQNEGMFQSVPDEFFLSKESTKYAYMLPWRCPQGCAIIVHDFGKWDHSEMSLDNFERLALMVFEQSLRDPMSQIHGFKIVYNFKDVSLKHLRYCTPSNIMLFYHVALGCVPSRNKEIYIVPHSPIFKIMWEVIKRLLSPKVRKRIKFLGRPEDLAQFLPPEILPPHYGGALKYDPTDWLRRISKDHGHFGMGGQPNYY